MRLSDKTYKKFIDSKSLEDFEILSDTGWVDCVSINKTIPYQIYSILTENGLTLRGADTHILFDENFNEIYLKDSLNKSIQTEFGISKVITLGIEPVKENMYDIEVNSENHRYYTNSILSHNTTFSGAYLLWKSLFSHDIALGITAQSNAGAQEVFDRIQMMFEMLPFFLQPGVKTYNRTSMRFHNRNKMFVASPTKKSLRGKSLDCVSGDTKVTIEKDGVISETEISDINFGEMIYEVNDDIDHWKDSIFGKHDYYVIDERDGLGIFKTKSEAMKYFGSEMNLYIECAKKDSIYRLSNTEKQKFISREF